MSDTTAACHPTDDPILAAVQQAIIAYYDPNPSDPDRLRECAKSAISALRRVERAGWTKPR